MVIEGDFIFFGFFINISALSDKIDNANGIGEGEALNGIGYGDGVTDNERFGMRRFLYFNRQGNGCQTDPTSGTEYYNYMRGIWRCGAEMTYGGTGLGGTLPADFMFFACAGN